MSEKFTPETLEESCRRGWRCFHCDETFHTVGGAEDHFGATPRVFPGCVLKVQLGEERGMLMELRKLQAENESLHAQINEGIFNDKAFYAHLEIMIQSYLPFRKCRTLQDVFNVYDSLEGRAIAAEERVAAASDLYEACKAMYEEYEHVARNSYCNSDEESLRDTDVERYDPEGFAVWIKARAAIAKAEGK